MKEGIIPIANSTFRAARSYRDPNWLENRIKGSLAEILIQEMFDRMNFIVYPIKSESTMPHLMNLVNQGTDEISLSIRRRPDFIVKNQTTGKSFELDVKFKSKGWFDNSNCNDNPYNQAYIILITLDSIQCGRVEDIKSKKVLLNNTRNHFLEDCEDFNFEQGQIEIIREFTQMAKNVFSKIPFTK